MMQTEAAKKLIEETFNQPYDLGRFKKFLAELTKGYEDRSKPSIVPDNFKDGIKSVFRIGKFKDAKGDEIDLVAVTLQSDHSLDRARTFQRNYIARYLKGREKDAALVAFVAPESGSWRFSLVRRELGIKLNAKGKTKAFDEISPARRFSFLVGKGEKTHTAKRQLMPLLETDSKPSLSNLEKAFNIETVTDEFFEEYRELFGAVKDQIDEHLKGNAPAKKHFTEKDISSADFAKRLLGQIVFLYFLQKKGWLGVPKDKKWGEGSKTFLRDLYEKAKKDNKNFFNEYLEPLFYEALNRDHSDNNHYYKLFDSRIPFLNGGLFDAYHDYAWAEVDIELPNEIFSKQGKSLFAGIDGVGILDVFDRYNFTVAEDEPLEREVAIDPEMLGKVFERLLPAAERGDKGTFYTPREIVHYMCQESLIAYLGANIEGLDKTEVEDFIRYGDLMLEHDARVLSGDKTDTYKDVFLGKTIQENLKPVDEALAQVKVCDPAIGSGAFPVGMMSEIVRARKLLAVHRSAEVSNYDLKRDTIHNSLYGVDLDSGAIEIAKLRLWLSLVVDEDSFDNIQALPNLDYKIMQGNSLLQTFEGVQLFKETLLKTHDNHSKRKKQLQQDVDNLINTLQTMKANASFKMSPKQTEAIEEEIKKKTKSIKDLEKLSKEQVPDMLKLESKATELSEQLKKLHTDFFRSASPAEKKKIRARIEELEWQLIEASLKEQGKSSKLDEIKKLQKANVKPYFLWRLHFSDVFAGENGGFDIVIANPPYGVSMQSKNDSQFILSYPVVKKIPDSYCCFMLQGFNVLKHQGLLSFIVPNTFCDLENGDLFRRHLLENTRIIQLWQSGWAFESAIVDTLVFIAENDTANLDADIQITVGHQKYVRKPKDFLSNNLAKIDYRNPPGNSDVLKKIQSSSVPLSTIAEVKAGVKMYEKGKGTPPQTEKIVNEKSYSVKGKCPNGWQPLYRGTDIGRYSLSAANEFVNYGPHLAAPRSPELFQSPKILMRRTDDHLRSCIETNSAICVNSCHIIKFKPQSSANFSYEFLLGVLNSNLCQYAFEIANPQMVGKVFAEIKVVYVEGLPIPMVSREKQRALEDLVSQMLKAKASANTSHIEVSSLEQLIDTEVYKLFNLTPDDISIIESATKDAQKKAS